MSKKVGAYLLQEVLGRGNYGTVFKALNTVNSETVAVKAMPMRQLTGKLLQQLECEIKVLKKLKSPNIVQLFDVLKTSNNVYLVMEYCPGGDLEKVLRTRGRVDEATAQKWLAQLVAVFIELQRHQIMHRDLKLANLLLTEEGDLKLADFGFARFLNEDSLAMTQLGTPMFMAPEIFNGQPYSYKADVWSLGVLAYEILVGAPAFACKTVAQLRRLQSAGVRFPRDCELSENAQEFVRSMTAYECKKRPSFEELQSHEFLMLHQEEVVEEKELTEEDEYVDLAEEEIEEEIYEDVTLEEAPEEAKEIKSDSEASQRTTELDYRICQIEEIMDYQEQLVYREKTEAALYLGYYCNVKLNSCLEEANVLSQRLSLTRSCDSLFSELYEKIQVHCFNSLVSFESLANQLSIETQDGLSKSVLTRLHYSVLDEVSARLQLDNIQFHTVKLTLSIAAAVVELSVDSEAGKQLFEEAKLHFAKAKYSY